MIDQEIRCPLCRLAPDAAGTCPDCGQDLAPLTYLAVAPALAYNTALAQADAGDDDGAVRSLQQAVAQDEGFLDAWMVLGKLHARNGRADEARRAWGAVLAVDPAHQGATEASARLDETVAGSVGSRRRGWLVGGLAVLPVLAVVAGLLLWRPGGPAGGEAGEVGDERGFFAVVSRGDEVLLAGPVLDDGRRLAYLDAAASAAAGRRTIDSMLVDPNTVPVPDLEPEVVAAVVGALVSGPLGGRSVILGGPQVVLTGAVPDEGARAAFVAALRAALPAAVLDDQLAVGPVSATGDAARQGATLLAVQSASPIRFGPQGVGLSPPGRATVALVADFLRREPQLSVWVDGHAARTASGSPENAARVSQDRAAAVRDALLAAGIGPERLSVRAQADGFPLGTAAASRRVEISVR